MNSQNAFKLSLALFFLICIGLNANIAQNGVPRLIPRVSFRTDLLPYINPFRQAATLAIDVAIAPKFSLELEPGYFYHGSNIYYKGEYVQGWRLRSAAKYYFQGSKKSYNTFIGLEGKYNKLTRRNYETVSRQGGQYIQEMLLDRKVLNSGMCFTLGYQVYLGKNKRIIFQSHGGLGVSYNNVSRALPPDGDLLNRNIVFQRGLGIKWSPDLVFGVDLGFCLW